MSNLVLSLIPKSLLDQQKQCNSSWFGRCLWNVICGDAFANPWKFLSTHTKVNHALELNIAIVELSVDFFSRSLPEIMVYNLNSKPPFNWQTLEANFGQIPCEWFYKQAKCQIWWSFVVVVVIWSKAFEPFECDTYYNDCTFYSVPQSNEAWVRFHFPKYLTQVPNRR